VTSPDAPRKLIFADDNATASRDANFFDSYCIAHRVKIKSRSKLRLNRRENAKFTEPSLLILIKAKIALPVCQGRAIFFVKPELSAPAFFYDCQRGGSDQAEGSCVAAPERRERVVFIDHFVCAWIAPEFAVSSDVYRPATLYCAFVFK
jgi:hypothetical protein